MTIKLIATDMDGTLLDPRGQLDLPRLEKILDQLDERGIRFVIATGNEVHRMRQLLEHLASRVVLIVANGARIFEHDTLLQAQTWDDAMVDKALLHFKGRECRDQFVVTSMNGSFVKKGTVFTDLEKFMTPEMIEKLYQRTNFVDELNSDLFGGVLKMSMVIGEERSSSVLQEINDLFDGRVRAVSSGYGCIDILQAGVHKAWGLEELLKRWDLTSEQIMAFGDSENDVEMLEMAGIAYAMENADDEAKAVATALAPANSQGGVYQILENWLEKEGCLSVDRVVPGYVVRHARVTVDYFDKDGEKHRIKLKGYNSIVVQHEIDHLNGIMFYDRINEKDPFAVKEGLLILE